MAGGQGGVSRQANDHDKRVQADFHDRLTLIRNLSIACIPLTVLVSYGLWRMLPGGVPDVECTFDLGNQCYRAVLSASELVSALQSGTTGAGSSSLLALKAAAGWLEGATNVACHVVGTAVCRAEELVAHLAR